MMAATPSLAWLLSFDREASKSRPVEPSSFTPARASRMVG
jgi:hypothetical protein